MINKLIRWYLRNYKWNNFYILNLKDLFKNLSKYEYFLIKTDVFYVPKEFPEKYPIGKDLDIFSSKKDFQKVNNILLDFANKYKNIFNVKVLKNNKNYKVRLEKFNNLYFLFDNNCLDFLKEAMKHRIYNNGYYILPLKYEIIFRLYEIKKIQIKFIILNM